jgi:formylmethanofuran dehydrogenase subunit E
VFFNPVKLNSAVTTHKENSMRNERKMLTRALEFHGHRCWASVASARAGLAALRVLNIKRSGSRQLHAFVEIGDNQGGMCLGDSVQYATGCTLGKDNMEKMPNGKLAVTVIERATNRAVRVSYKPPLVCTDPPEKAFALRRQPGAGGSLRNPPRHPATGAHDPHRALGPAAEA